jgi:hypothetical protein
MKSNIKRLFHQVFFTFVTLWVGGWLFLFPRGIQNSPERAYAENTQRECYADGNWATEAQDCVNLENAEYRWYEANWKFPNFYRYIWKPILVWGVFLPIDLYVLIRGLAIYFVWAHPYIDFDGLLDERNSRVVVPVVVLAAAAVMVVFPMFLVFDFIVGLVLAAAVAFVWNRVSPRR